MNRFERYSMALFLLMLANMISWASFGAEKGRARGHERARTTPTDWIRAEQGELSVHGTSLLSFEEKYVFVQSDRVFLQLQRGLIKTVNPVALDRPGSRVELLLPQRAIQYAWLVDFGGSEEPRALGVTRLR
jgi:hypothetical protein